MTKNKLFKLLRVLFWYAIFDSLVLGYAGFIPGPQLMSAQTILTTTTLSTAAPGTTQITAGSAPQQLQYISLASATGVNAPNPINSTVGAFAAPVATYLYVDRELLDVRLVSGTTIGVVRGAESTQVTAHASGALVYVIPASVTVFIGPSGSYAGSGPAAPAGSCTRSQELALPRISFGSGVISDCVGGQWVNGDALGTVRNSGSVLYAPQPGAVAYSTINTAGTTLAATTMYCTEIQLPYSKFVTGLGVLNGSTVGTDNHLVALYDATGNLIANSATAGVLAAGASTYQQISFTSKYYLVGPAQYFGCMQTNGTTATVRMLVTGVQDTYLTKGVTGQTFGTIPATITVPTTFTTAVGPYFTLF